MIVHAGLVAMLDRQRWKGVLITGPSGAGKSILALGLMGTGFSLVADDRVSVWTSGGEVYGRAPENLKGLMELYGYGVFDMPFRAFSSIDLIVDVDPEAEIERVPEPMTRELLGKPIPLVHQRARQGAAAAKIRRWLIGLG